jgi:hypothetical protein
VKKNQPRLAKGIAFYRPLDTALLGSGSYVRIARFEGATIPVELTEVYYYGDSVFPQSVDYSEANAGPLTFEKMIFVVPEPAEIEQEPRGNWSVFDLWGINYEYQYGAYNLSSTGANPTQGRTFHLGSAFVDNLPEGQILLRAWGGPKRILEWEFYRIRASKFSMTLSKNEYQTFSLTLPTMVNPSYTHATYGPDGLVVSMRSFEKDITKLS